MLEAGLLIAIIVLPFVTASLAAMRALSASRDSVQIIGASVLLLLTLFAITLLFKRSGEALVLLPGWLALDALGAFMVLLIALIGFLATLYGIPYMAEEFRAGRFSSSAYRRYVFLFHSFLGAMITAALMMNLGLLWVGIELTTLISALTVSFYGRPTSLEAAWKYVLMGSVGLTLALLGLIFLFVATTNVPELQGQALDWQLLHETRNLLAPNWMMLAFVLTLVGYGTKAGLAPFHFWLPDAHSESPSPVSGVLSALLLNTALLGLLRMLSIMPDTLLAEAHTLLRTIGAFSLLFAVPFIFVQWDIKRLLAYSSVEHMGIIVLALGAGGVSGTFAALLHMFNHSVVKSLAFFSAGRISQVYGTKRIAEIKGAVHAMPFVGGVWMLAMLGAAGTPPFNVFLSEWLIMKTLFTEGHVVVGTLMVTAVVLVFAAFVTVTVRMLYGTPETKEGHASPSEARGAGGVPERATRLLGGRELWMGISFVVLASYVLIGGVVVPNSLTTLIRWAAELL
ncbi:MAG: hydrogenase 4 subunit F [Candidatus Carbobacillus altaicus]|nr:hydrogenase 4 subunit F [Candidatus Carbobacillus altaicus]